MNKFILPFLFFIVSLCACESTSSETDDEDEMQKVENLRKSDEQRMDSMRRALGVD